MQITSTNKVTYKSTATDTCTEFYSGQILSPSMRTNILDEFTQKNP